MDEQEREGFIKKIGISAGNSEETDDEEEDDDPERHKYNCKKCQVRFVLTSTGDENRCFVCILECKYICMSI